jgi:hypothetical protein
VDGTSRTQYCTSRRVRSESFDSIRNFEYSPIDKVKHVASQSECMCVCRILNRLAMNGIQKSGDGRGPRFHSQTALKVAIGSIIPPGKTKRQIEQNRAEQNIAKRSV